MFKLFFDHIWANIKRSPIVSVILFLQIVLVSYFMFVVLFSLNESNLQNEAVQRVYAEKSMFALATNDNIDINEISRAMGIGFSAENKTMYSDYEAFYEKTISSQDIETAVMYDTPVVMREPLTNIPVNETTVGYYSYYDQASLTVENGGFYQINAFSVDQDYIDIFGLTLDSGRLFTEEEFSDIDVNRVPVILGYGYKGKYDIGDTFEASLFPGEKLMTYEVIGFTSEKHIFFKHAGKGPYLFDTYMILPYVYKTVDEWIAFREEFSEYRGPNSFVWNYYIAGLGATSVTCSRHFLIENGKEEILEEFLKGALKETGLDAYYVLNKSYATALQVSDYTKEIQTIMSILVIIMIVFSFLSIIFSSINNASNNIKSYAVHNLIGATQPQIISYAFLETFLYCTLGFLAGYMWYYIFYISYMRYESHPVFNKTNQIGFLISVLFIVISCILTYIFVYLKMQNYSVAELIRGREVKKRNNLPLYKSLTFIMFLFASVCITFITSYIWQVDHMDKYQYNYWKRNVDCIMLNSLPQEDAPEVLWEYDIDGLENYSVDICINFTYGNNGIPCIRGWFYKDDFNIPEITEGRFFTQEECSQVLDIAVVGKNVLKDFVEEKDGKRILRYDNRDYEVVGIVGREGHETTIDDWVFLTAETVVDLYGMRFYPILIEGATDEITKAVLENIDLNSENHYIYSSMNVNPYIDLGISNDFLMIFVALIFLTVIVFSVYYIDKIKHIINVKKFLGYSKKTILLDTSAQFVALSSVAYLVGNLLMYVISKTLLKDFALFSAFQINLPVLLFSYGLILLISVLFSIIAINKAFRGSARDLKRE